jgi:hypothetical protein
VLFGHELPQHFQTIHFASAVLHLAVGVHAGAEDELRRFGSIAQACSRLMKWSFLKAHSVNPTLLSLSSSISASRVKYYVETRSTSASVQLQMMWRMIRYSADSRAPMPANTLAQCGRCNMSNRLADLQSVSHARRTSRHLSLRRHPALYTDGAKQTARLEMRM